MDRADIWNPLSSSFIKEEPLCSFSERAGASAKSDLRTPAYCPAGVYVFFWKKHEAIINSLGILVEAA